MKFYKGDIVKCINDNNSNLPVGGKMLYKDGLYEVGRCDGYYVCPVGQSQSRGNGWDISRFELVQRANPKPAPQ